MTDTDTNDPFEAFADARRAQAAALGAYVRERDARIEARMARIEAQNNEIIQALGYLRGQLDKRGFR